MRKLLSKVKKYIFSFLPKNDLHGFEYTVTELVGMYEKSNEAIKWHGKILDNEILKYKTSDTVFILGSGPSINNISDSDWIYISKNDSIGFNYWFVHEFVPNIYVFQHNKSNDNMLKILQDIYAKYINIPFVIRGSAFAKGLLNFDDERLQLVKNNDLYYLREFPIASRCAVPIELLFKFTEALGLMTHGEIAPFVPKWRGTLGLMIMLCYQMGYKKIVLCGMDMHDNAHFWDYKPYISIRDKYNLTNKGQSKIYQFTDQRISPNTVPEYVYALRDWMKEKNGVGLYVMNKQTILYPKLPLFQ